MGAVKKAIVSASFASAALAHSSHMKRGTVPADGTIWTSCVTPGVVALTFDDGPFSYTQKIVDDLTAAGHKATFFQNGQNYDNINNYASVLQSMIAGGHQVASHTWSHADLATLTADQIVSEMGQLEAAHIALIGKAPTYMRPPYLSLNDLAITTLKGLGYKIVEVDIDTQDWAEGPIGQIELSIEWFKGNLTNGGSLSLNHDPYQPTADTFVPAIISYLDSKGLKSVTAGECLGDDAANWYRGAGSLPSSALPPASSGASSTPPAGNGTSPPQPSGTSGHGPGSPTGSGPGYPTGAYPPSGGHGGGKGKPVKGGDTEPGHGDNSGRGAMPGHRGEGNHGSSGYGSGSGGYGGSGNGTGTGSYPYPGNSSTSSPRPTYYSNSASALTGSAVIVGAAALFALFL